MVATNEERVKKVSEWFMKTRGRMPERYTTMGEYNVDFLEAFQKMYDAVVIKPGALTRREKELIIIAVECALMGPDAKFHAKNAIEAGATVEEVHDAALISFLWAGMPSYVGHGWAAVKNAEEFYKEFKSKKK